MGRLTEVRGKDIIYIGRHARLIELGESACSMTVAAIREVMQRLAEYEATGLEPEQIKKHQPQIVAVQKIGRAFMFDCCKICKAPKRQPGCQDHCPEYKKAKAAFEARKAAYAQARGRSIGTVYAQRADAVNRATRRGRR